MKFLIFYIILIFTIIICYNQIQRHYGKCSTGSWTRVVVWPVSVGSPQCNLVTLWIWIIGNVWRMMNAFQNAANIMGCLLCSKTSALWWEKLKARRKMNGIILLKIFLIFQDFIFKPIMIFKSQSGIRVLVWNRRVREFLQTRLRSPDKRPLN